MAKRKRARLPAGVARLRDRIEHWRRTRPRRTLMPEELWARAVALARAGKPYAIAQALRIDFDSLRRRMAEAAAGAAAAAPRGTGFVELKGAQIIGRPSSAGPVVELADAAGIRVTVRLAAGAQLDVAHLISALRRRGDA